MKKAVWGSGAAAALLTLSLAPTTLATGGTTSQVLAVYGDAPYGTSPTDTAQFDATPAFIRSVNADPDVSTVLQVGDIHSGKQYCTREYDKAVANLWKGFDDPLVYTPGDNEWADCHKPAEGGGTYNASTGQIDYVRDSTGDTVDYAGGNPVANLGLVRSIFFPKPGQSLGAHKKAVLSQANVADQAHPSDAKYVENVIFVQGGTLFVTIDLPGGSNNDNDVWYGAPARSAEQDREIAERTGADLRWLDRAFAMAGPGSGIGSVVIQAQADMWDPEKGAAHQAQYEPFVAAVASHASAFGGPVLMLNGDSHVYQAGNPLTPDNAIHPGYDVPNFERIVVHGSTAPLEWLKLTVDPGANSPRTDTAYGPFSWQRMIQP